MTKIQTDFLECYKKLEGILRENGRMVKDYEEMLSESDGNKLRLCRMIRNFLSHEKDGEKYADVSQALYDFLQNMVWSLSEGEIPVSKKAKAISTGVTFKTPLNEALKGLSKKTVLNTEGIPVFDKGEYVGLLTTDTIVKAMCKDKFPTAKSQVKVVAEFLNKEKLAVVKKTDTLATAAGICNKKPVLVETDGKLTGFLR